MIKTPVLRNAIDKKGVNHLLIEDENGNYSCLCGESEDHFTDFGKKFMTDPRPNLFNVTCPECLAVLYERYEGVNVIPQECEFIPHEWIENGYIVYESANREVVTVKNIVTGKIGQDWTKEKAIARTL